MSRSAASLAALWMCIVSAIFIPLTVLLAVCMAPRAHMDPDGPIGWPPIQCGRPCVIEESHGGIIVLFNAEARVLKAMDTQVIIDGPCISACVGFADILRDNVCVTTNAVFGIHQSALGTKFADIVYEDPRLNAYIKAHGGEPAPDSGTLLMVPYQDLIQFYKPCAGAA